MTALRAPRIIATAGQRLPDSKAGMFQSPSRRSRVRPQQAKVGTGTLAIFPQLQDGARGHPGQPGPGQLAANQLQRDCATLRGGCPWSRLRHPWTLPETSETAPGVDHRYRLT